MDWVRIAQSQELKPLSCMGIFAAWLKPYSSVPKVYEIGSTVLLVLLAFHPTAKLAFA
jgi:hypothetical protein